MKSRKLMPKIKIASFNENEVSTPLSSSLPKCPCDVKLVYTNCQGNPMGFYRLDICQPDNWSICAVEPAFKDDCVSNYKTPLSSELPSGCECYSSNERHVVTEQITEISKLEKKTSRQKKDRRTGEKIE